MKNIMEMEKKNKKSKVFLANLKGKLEKQLNYLVKKNKLEVKKLVAKELVEMEKKNEKKFKNLYCWLLAIFLVFLLLIVGVLFLFKKQII